MPVPVCRNRGMPDYTHAIKKRLTVFTRFYNIEKLPLGQQCDAGPTGGLQTNTRKREMEESQKKKIELKWRRLIEAANLESEKPSRPNHDVPGEVTVIRRRKRRIVTSAA